MRLAAYRPLLMQVVQFPAVTAQCVRFFVMGKAGKELVCRRLLSGSVLTFHMDLSHSSRPVHMAQRLALRPLRYAPFDPPLRPNGTALYIGAHRGGEDGLEFHRRGVALQMHLFESLEPGEVVGFPGLGLGSSTMLFRIGVPGVFTPLVP